MIELGGEYTAPALRVTNTDGRGSDREYLTPPVMHDSFNLSII